MKILIVGLVTNPQFLRIKEEGEKQGHTIDGCYTSDLTILASEKEFQVLLKDKPIPHYDLIYLWALGARRWEWYTACLYLNKVGNTKIVNNKSINATYNYYLTPAIDYLKQFENTLKFPKTLTVFNSKQLETKISGFEFPLIVKVANGRQGKGVYKTENLEDLQNTVSKIIVETKSAVIREFIPNDGDIRVFTIGYKAIGAMQRTPKAGDFRSNISQGGSGQPFDLLANPEIVQIAQKASEVMQTEIAGVDIMLHKETKEPYILEVNPGPQFTGLEKYTGINVAYAIIKYFEEVVTK